MRVLIAISGCEAWENIGWQQAMRDTWLADAVRLGWDYKIFHGRGGTPKSDVEVIDCDDAYFDLTSKLKEKLKYALRNGYEYVFCGLTDTYGCIERLQSCGFENFDYFGDLLGHANGDYCQGGAGFFLSRAAAELVAGHPANYPNEDCFVGDIMRANAETMRRGHHPGFMFYGNTYSPEKGNGAVTAHLSSVDGGYKPEYTYEAHRKWLESNGRPNISPTEIQLLPIPAPVYETRTRRGPTEPHRPLSRGF